MDKRTILVFTINVCWNFRYIYLKHFVNNSIEISEPIPSSTLGLLAPTSVLLFEKEERGLQLGLF